MTEKHDMADKKHQIKFANTVYDLDIIWEHELDKMDQFSFSMNIYDEKFPTKDVEDGIRKGYKGLYIVKTNDEEVIRFMFRDKSKAFLDDERIY